MGSQDTTKYPAKQIPSEAFRLKGPSVMKPTYHADIHLYEIRCNDDDCTELKIFL